jgi:hypothetical protein
LERTRSRQGGVEQEDAWLSFTVVFFFSSSFSRKTLSKTFGQSSHALIAIASDTTSPNPKLQLYFSLTAKVLTTDTALPLSL